MKEKDVKDCKQEKKETGLYKECRNCLYNDVYVFVCDECKDFSEFRHKDTCILKEE